LIGPPYLLSGIGLLDLGSDERYKNLHEHGQAQGVYHRHCALATKGRPLIVWEGRENALRVGGPEASTMTKSGPYPLPSFSIVVIKSPERVQQMQPETSSQTSSPSCLMTRLSIPISPISLTTKATFLPEPQRARTSDRMSFVFP
jgi:hypothetical protein